MGSGGQTMQTAQDLFQTALDAATLGLDALNQAVADFKGAVDIKLAGWAEGITDDMKKASDALKKAMNDFTNALGGTATDGTTTTPGNKKNPTDGLNLLATATTDAVGDEKTGLIAFTKAINAATAAVAGN